MFACDTTFGPADFFSWLKIRPVALVSCHHLGAPARPVWHGCRISDGLDEFGTVSARIAGGVPL
jgi:hypothetical protein